MTLAARDRRALGVGALIVASALVWRVVVTPLAARVTEARDRGDAAAAVFARELALVRDSRTASTRLVAARREFDDATARLLTAPDSAAARRALVARVQAFAAAARLDALRVDAAPMDPSTGLILGAQIDMRARSDAEALSRFLSAIEDPDSGLRIEQLSIERNDSGSLTFTARVRALVRRSAP